MSLSPPFVHGAPRRRSRTALSVLAVCAIGIGLAWTVEAAQATQRVEEQVVTPLWREEASFTYRVPVANGTSGFENGTVLGMGEPGYFSTISPRVEVAFQWRAIGQTAPNASIHAEIVAVAAARSGEASWRVEERLANVSLTQSAPDARLDGVLDFPSLERRLSDEAPRRATAAALAPWTIVATVRSAWGATGHAPVQTSTFELPLTYEPPLYVLPDAPQTRHVVEHVATQVVVHETRPGLAGLRAAPHGPVALAAGATALALMWLPPTREAATLRGEDA